MAKIYSICTQQGGVGKTVTAVNLGIGLVREGKRVALCDLDAQASLSISLGHDRPDELEMTIATVMRDEIKKDEIKDDLISVRDIILPNEEGVDLIPANIDLAALEVRMADAMSRETILRECLKPIYDDYDIIIIDTMPSLGMLTINALAAADAVIIPSSAQYLSMKGLEQLIRTIMKVKRKINPSLSVAGILITMMDNRTTYSREICEIIRSTYGSRLRVFDSVIPRSIRAAETSAEGVSIYRHDPAGKVAKAYAALTREVLAL